MAKILIITGTFLLITGFLMYFKLSVPFLGRLPGDIFIKKDHFSLYFPMTTSLLLSIGASLLLYLLSRKV
ncbi:MAG: DUF2905 domain-containing protein [Parachlamydiaceae bacterium]